MLKILRKNRTTLEGLTQDQIDDIKQDLTFDNPAYLSALRFAKNPHYITIPKYLTYYDSRFEFIDGENQEVLTVPIGYDLTRLKTKNRASFSDERNDQMVKYPEPVMKLRSDQEKAANTYFNHLRTHDEESFTYPKSIIQLPTGKGKTIVALYIAYMLSQRTLILVHKNDLVVSWQQDIQDFFNGAVKSGLIKAKKRDIGKYITIATFQTLHKLDEPTFNDYMKNFGLVVHDEVHHTGLNMFNIVDRIPAFYRLGLSATPKRTDGLDQCFDLFYGGIGYQHGYVEEDEDICSVRIEVKDSPCKMEPFLHEGLIYNLYDFKKSELPDKVQFLKDIHYQSRPRIPFNQLDDWVVSSSPHKYMVCRDILHHYRQGHSCIALFSQKDHIRQYMRFLSMFIPKGEILLYYGDNKEESSVLMEKAESKECLVTLATYAKATEGTNVKSWEVGFLVSSINNDKNVEQATGRIRRIKKGKLNPVIFYDYRLPNVYSQRNHFNTRLKVYKRLKYKLPIGFMK